METVSDIPTIDSTLFGLIEVRHQNQFSQRKIGEILRQTELDEGRGPSRNWLHRETGF